MSRLSWGISEMSAYEFGLDRGVIYPKNSAAVTWEGLRTAKETIEADTGAVYVDGVAVGRSVLTESFSADLEAFTYPSVLDEAKPFALSYRTMLSGDQQRIHLVYGCSLQEQDHENSSGEASVSLSTFKWRLNTVPSALSGYAPTAHLIVDSTMVNALMLANFEDLIYGTDTSEAELPSQEEVVMFFDGDILQIIDNGDGSWSAIGPTALIVYINDETAEITADSIVFLDEDTYTIESY